MDLVHQEECMTSIKKINANRLNAKCSTGPISKKGKLNSSKNAIKHGLHAEKFVVIGESVVDLEIIRDRLVDELKPIGIMQEQIVEKMVDLAIRLRRIPIIEAGIFNHEMLEHEADEYKEKVASTIEGETDNRIVLSSNTLVRKTGLSFARDCNQGSAILKLNTIEDKLLSKYFKLYGILMEMQS